MDLYGSSRYLISSSESLISTAPTLDVIRHRRRETTRKEELTNKVLQFIEGRGADDGSRDDCDWGPS
jgi:hypothetical protein